MDAYAAALIQPDQDGHEELDSSPKSSQLGAKEGVAVREVHGTGSDHRNAEERGRVLVAMIVIRLQTIVSREIALTESAVVSVGSLQAPAPSPTSSVIMRFCS